MSYPQLPEVPIEQAHRLLDTENGALYAINGYDGADVTVTGWEGEAHTIHGALAMPRYKPIRVPGMRE